MAVRGLITGAYLNCTFLMICIEESASLPAAVQAEAGVVADGYPLAQESASGIRVMADAQGAIGHEDAGGEGGITAKLGAANGVAPRLPSFPFWPVTTIRISFAVRPEAGSGDRLPFLPISNRPAMCISTGF